MSSSASSRALLLLPTSTATTMDDHAKNIAAIQANRKKIYELENQVVFNRGQVFEVCASVVDQSRMIAKNYDSAFLGNRQLANQNTDDLFRNRLDIIRSLEAGGGVTQQDYREALRNKTKLEYLEHLSRLNETVLKVAGEMAEINVRMEAVVEEVTGTNETVVVFNSGMIESNNDLLQKRETATKNASSSLNTQLIAMNSSKITEITKRAADNRAKIDKISAATVKSGEVVSKTAEDIAKRKKRIQENHAKIATHQKLIAELLLEGS